MSGMIPKHRVWPTIIIGVLLLDVTVGVAMMRLAASDPHAAVESDYYRKAVDWDSTLAQGRRNAALGWDLRPELSAIAPGDSATFRVRLLNRSGVPVHDAIVTAEAMQLAHAEEVVHLRLQGDADDGYVARAPIGRTGLWEFRIAVTRGTDRFTSVVRLDASRDREAVVVTDRPGDAPKGVGVPAIGR